MENPFSNNHVHGEKFHLMKNQKLVCEYERYDIIVHYNHVKGMSSKSGSENLSKAESENLSKSTSENLPSIGSNEDVSWRIDEFSQKLRSLMSEVDSSF